MLSTHSAHSLHSQQSDAEYTTQISYMEIYNESGYDLLDPNHEFGNIENLPKVQCLLPR